MLLNVTLFAGKTCGSVTGQDFIIGNGNMREVVCTITLNFGTTTTAAAFAITTITTISTTTTADYYY